MKKTPPKKPLTSAVRGTVLSEKKKWKKKTFRLKAKIIFVFVLPVVCVLIALKAARTFLHIKIREIFSDAPDPKVREESVSPTPKKKPVPLEGQAVEVQLITPEPVNQSK